MQNPSSDYCTDILVIEISQTSYKFSFTNRLSQSGMAAKSQVSRVIP